MNTFEAWGWGLGILVCGAAFGCSESEGGGEGSGASSEGDRIQLETASRLRSCGLITEGRVNLDDISGDDELCFARCIADLESCDDLERVVCDDDLSPLLACFSACEEAEGTFTCGDGEEIPGSWECDFDEDCTDGSDEANCEDAGFTCDDGTRLPADWRCDGEEDCFDGSDEEGCPASATFTCGDGEEIPGSWECDFEEDCTDGSDEDGCAQLLCE